MSNQDKELSKQKRKTTVEEEVAATTMAGYRRGIPAYSNRTSFKPLIVRAFLIVFFVLLLMGLTALMTSLFFMKEKSATVIQTTNYVEQINDLAYLATAEAHMKEVLEIEDNKLFGKNIPISLFGAARRHVLIIVPATVVAGVDLTSVTDGDVLVDEEAKTIAITLPRATLMQEPAILVDEIVTYSDEGIFRKETNWNEGVEFLELAQEQLKLQAMEVGLYQTAEKNAEKALQNFYKGLGYTATITFE